MKYVIWSSVSVLQQHSFIRVQYLALGWSVSTIHHIWWIPSSFDTTSEHQWQGSVLPCSEREERITERKMGGSNCKLGQGLSQNTPIQSSGYCWAHIGCSTPQLKAGSPHAESCSRLSLPARIKLANLHQMAHGLCAASKAPHWPYPESIIYIY
jgi:hypothetical protein